MDTEFIPPITIVETKSLTDDGLIVALLQKDQTLAMNQNPTKYVKLIKFFVESFTKGGTPSQAEDHFFKSKFRSLDPKKPEHNMPLGVITCLQHLPVGKEFWFKIWPEHLGNPSIQGYPTETDPVYYKLRVQQVQRLKSVDPTDLGSYVQCLLIFKEEGNEFFERKDFVQAFEQYDKGIKQANSLPKKLMENSRNANDPLLAELDKRHVDLLNNMAYTCQILKKTGEGIGYALKSLAIDPYKAKSKYRLASLYEEEKRYEEAQGLYVDAGMDGCADRVKRRMAADELRMKRAFQAGIRDDPTEVQGE